MSAACPICDLHRLGAEGVSAFVLGASVAAVVAADAAGHLASNPDDEERYTWILARIVRVCCSVHRDDAREEVLRVAALLQSLEGKAVHA